MLNRILGLLGWLGVALVFAAVVVRWFRPAQQVVYNGLAIAGLACTLLYMLSQWREIVRALSGRRVRFGALSIGSIAAVLAILAGINYIAGRQNLRWDLTANRQFTLAEQTQKVLAGLEAPVTIHVFERSDQFERFRNILTEYEAASSRVSVEYVDPDARPTLAQEFGVESYGTVVFEYAGRRERAVSSGEQELTNALIKVVEGREQRAYFVQGHGEKDPTSSERSGYNSISQSLESDNFQVEQLALAQKPEVPADATVVVVAGPQTDYLPTELDALRAYLKQGGKALFMLDPPAQIDSPPLPALVALLREYAIEVGENIVVDMSGMGRLIGTDAWVPVALSYPAHPITERFNILTAFPVARSMSPISDGVDGHHAQSIIETGPQSWAEMDVKAVLTSGSVERDEGKGDKLGPVGIGAAISIRVSGPEETEQASSDNDEPASERREPDTRVVAIGDSDFATNYAVGIQGNRDLFLNTVNWLAQQENLIAIRPREPDDRRITLTAEQERRVMWLSIFIIPGLLLAAGVRAWWRRR